MHELMAADTKSKGLYGGAQLDGTIIVIRTDENARFYNTPEVTAKNILDGRFGELHPSTHPCHPRNHSAALFPLRILQHDADCPSAWPRGPGPEGLRATILAAEGKASAADLAIVPDGDDPSDTSLPKGDAEAERQLQAMNEKATLETQGRPTTL